MLAQQGKWKTLFDLSMKPPLPTYEPNPDDEVLEEHMAHLRTWHASSTQLLVNDN